MRGRGSAALILHFVSTSRPLPGGCREPRVTDGDTGCRRGSEWPGSHRKGRGVDAALSSVSALHWVAAPVWQLVSVGPDGKPPAGALPGERELGGCGLLRNEHPQAHRGSEEEGREPVLNEHLLSTRHPVHCGIPLRYRTAAFSWLPQHSAHSTYSGKIWHAALGHLEARPRMTRAPAGRGSSLGDSVPTFPAPARDAVPLRMAAGFQVKCYCPPALSLNLPPPGLKGRA